MNTPEPKTKVRRGKATITIPLCEYSDLRAKFAALEAENMRLTSLLNDTWPEHMKKYQALEAEVQRLREALTETRDSIFRTMALMDFKPNQHNRLQRIAEYAGRHINSNAGEKEKA